MIEIKNISKTFKNNKVLDGIDLTINQGDVVAIIGPSGTGKSTFLRCVDRLEKPETGTITIDGETQDLAHIHGKDLTELRKKTGMVFQNFNLFSKKTALQNVMEGLIVVKKMKKEEAERIAREQLKNVGLLDHANHYPRHMSGGQQQRVAIARALAMEPKLLLLDEPTSAREKCLEIQRTNVSKSSLQRSTGWKNRIIQFKRKTKSAEGSVDFFQQDKRRERKQ